MVSYGDSEFRQWAEENDFNDDDMVLIRKTVNKRKWLWVLEALATGIVTGAGISLANMSNDTLFKTISGIVLSIGGALGLIFYLFGLSLLVKCIKWSRIIKQGTLEPSPGLIGGLLSLNMVCSWISIFPLVIFLIHRKKLWGTGIDKLIKKGLIGNHEEAA